MNTPPIINIDDIEALLKELGGPESFFYLKEEQINKLHLSDKIKERLIKKGKETDINKLIAKLEKLDASISVYSDENFPKILKRTKNPPIIIYYKGNFDLLKPEPIFAVVGTRKSSAYGERLTYDTILNLATLKYPIITGTAIGIDTYTIKTSMELNSPCISVLSSGIDNISPKKNIELLEELIKKGGCYLTEFPPGVGSFKSNYPIRAKLIAALSTASIIIEAPEGSGALLVAKESFNLGRNAFCFPSYLHDDNFKGSHKAIEDSTAILVNNFEDIKKYQDL